MLRFNFYSSLLVESVEPNEDVSLNSFTSCPVSDAHIVCSCSKLKKVVQAFDQHTADFYSSPQFLQKAQEAAPFLNALAPYLDGRSTNFTNMVRKMTSPHGCTFLDSRLCAILSSTYVYSVRHLQTV